MKTAQILKLLQTRKGLASITLTTQRSIRQISLGHRLVEFDDGEIAILTPYLRSSLESVDQGDSLHVWLREDRFGTLARQVVVFLGVVRKKSEL